jgi:hypothetical protein
VKKSFGLEKQENQKNLAYKSNNGKTNIVFLLLGDSSAPEFYMPTFPKRRHIKFKRQGITQQKEYNIPNTAKI